jgi:hypothetical protein
MSLRPIELPSEDPLSRFQTKTPARLVHLQNVLNTAAKGGMLAKMRLKDTDFEIERLADDVHVFRRAGGLGMGKFTLFDSTYLIERLEVRNPTGKELEESEYVRSQVVYVQAYSLDRVGPLLEYKGGVLSVYDSNGKKYENALEQASGYGEPVDILAAVCSLSAARLFLEEKPPQTARPRIGILGL